MSRGWRHLLEEGRAADERRRDRMRKIEKIRKEKRSVRGRTEDDWLFDASDTEKETVEQRVAERVSQGWRMGRVMEVHKKHIFVAEEAIHGEPDTSLIWLCTVAKRHFQRAHHERNFVVVGDRVLVEPDRELAFDEHGEPIDTDLPRGLIQHAFVRHSKLSRQDPLRPEWEHVMLANINTIVVVASVLNPEVRWGLVDRLLVQAESQRVPAVIVLNKIDLVDSEKVKPEFKENLKRRIEIYRSIGYEVIELCALKPKKTPTALKRMRELFKGHITGVSGHSGVGKSSIVNLLKPEFEQIVDENPDIFYKGRHTTTYNSLIKLDIGGYIIDTPGVRSFTFGKMEAVDLSDCFREFRGYRCKYRECTHDHEPHCAIKQAVDDKKISPERYRSYIGMLKGESLREGGGMSDEAFELEADMQARAQMLSSNLDVATENED